MQTRYPSSILEEELKNRVAADWFGAFDCSRILGKVDFCAAVPATDLPLCDAESVLWAETKRGADAPLDFALVQLILTGKNKTDVSVVHATYNRYLEKIGIAGRELFAQFFMRIHDEIPGCVLGEFSKLKHLQSPNFKAFRQAFRASLEKCFIVPADTFDNVKGDFPIGFFVWRLWDGKQQEQLQGQLFEETRPNSAAKTGFSDAPVGAAREEVVFTSCPSCFQSQEGVFVSTVADVYDRKGEFIGRKTLLSYDNERSINDWLIETRKRHASLQLGFLSARSHDVQHILDIYFKRDKSLIKSARGSWITEANIVEACIYVAVCHSIEANWLNDRDQFLFPNDGWMDDAEFQSDCLVYTLFSSANYIRSCDGVNHWIPFTEEDVGAKDCFASRFMSDFISGRAGRPRSLVDARPYQAELFKMEKQADLLTPNGVRDSGNASGVSREQIRLLTLSPAARAVLDADLGGHPASLFAVRRAGNRLAHAYRQRSVRRQRRRTRRAGAPGGDRPLR